jgi:hypothetical protein
MMVTEILLLTESRWIGKYLVTTYALCYNRLLVPRFMWKKREFLHRLLFVVSFLPHSTQKGGSKIPKYTYIHMYVMYEMIFISTLTQSSNPDTYKVVKFLSQYMAHNLASFQTWPPSTLGSSSSFESVTGCTDTYIYGEPTEHRIKH